jgi:hypothetical protein
MAIAGFEAVTVIDADTGQVMWVTERTHLARPIEVTRPL